MLIFSMKRNHEAAGGGAVASLRTVDPNGTAGDFSATLNGAVNAIREVAGDAARTAERTQKIEAELSEKLRAAKAGTRTEYVPEGTARDVDARYVLDDGSVRLGRVEERLWLPDGKVVTVQREGLLTEAPSSVGQKIVQERYAAWALAARASDKFLGGQEKAAKIRATAFHGFRTALMNLGGRSGEFFRAALASLETAKRAIDGATGTGLELIFQPQLSTLRRPADLARRIPGLVATAPAPSKIFTPPIVTGRARARLRGTLTDDPIRLKSNNFTTSSTSVTVKDRNIQALVDPNWMADAATILGDPLGFIRQWLDEGDMLSLEVAFLHGDTNSSTLDTLTTWTMNGLYTAGDLSNSDELIKAWIGFRRTAYDDSTLSSGGGTWDISDHTTALAAMGNHQDKAWIVTGLNCLLTQLVASTSFLTWDKVGPAATILTGIPGGEAPIGTAGMIAGKPVVISEAMGKDFDSTTGAYTGSNKANEMVYVDPTAFTHYELGGDDYDVMREEHGAQFIGFTRRSVLVKTVVSGEKPCAAVYNL